MVNTAQREARQIYWRNRYESLKARGRCVVCGVERAAGGVRCEDCRIKQTVHSKRWQQKRRDELLAELERLRLENAELRTRLGMEGA